MKAISLFYPNNHEEHSSPNHPERPERVEAIRQALESAGLWNSEALLDPMPIPEEALHAIHTDEHLTGIEAASSRGGHIDADTYLTPASWRLALNAVGGGLAVVDSVWRRETERGFALCRPPGHHARPDQAMGFCLLNNIALAAEYLRQKHQAKRVAILDIDLHHGNGTQDIFYHREDVFFCSIHQYPLYPMTGLAHEWGAGAGEGTTLNIPYPPYAGDTARMTALEQIILPQMEDFRPDMLLVSAGFDAHWRDPLGHQLATANGYGAIIARLAAFVETHCEGRLAVFLEGGYDLEGGASSALAVMQALHGDTWQDELGPAPIPEDDFWQSRLQQVLDHWNK